MQQAQNQLIKPNQIISALLDLEPIKTWSLIVTMFGDLEGGSATGKQLRYLLEPLGIRAETTRVALHRLKRDGWITSEKIGREVRYQLSPRGIRETEAVYQDVFRRKVKYPDGWRLILVSDHRDVTCAMLPRIQIGRHITLVPRIENDVAGDAIETKFVGEGLPEWFQHRILSETTLKLAAKLEVQAACFEDSAGKMDGVTKLYIRLLLLHHWRKLALRPGCWAHIHYVPNGSVAGCHKRITRILENEKPIDLRRLRSPV